MTIQSLEFLRESRGPCGRCQATGTTHVYEVFEMAEASESGRRVGYAEYCPSCDMARAPGGSVLFGGGPWPGTVRSSYSESLGEGDLLGRVIEGAPSWVKNAIISAVAGLLVAGMAESPSVGVVAFVACLALMTAIDWFLS